MRFFRTVSLQCSRVRGKEQSRIGDDPSHPVSKIKVSLPKLTSAEPQTTTQTLLCLEPLANDYTISLVAVETWSIGQFAKHNMAATLETETPKLPVTVEFS